MMQGKTRVTRRSIVGTRGGSRSRVVAGKRASLRAKPATKRTSLKQKVKRAVAAAGLVARGTRGKVARKATGVAGTRKATTTRGTRRVSKPGTTRRRVSIRP